MTFYDWLQRQRRREDLVGDLARDSAADPSFPKTHVQAIHVDYFRNLPEEAREAFRSAWQEYRRVAQD